MNFPTLKTIIGLISLTVCLSVLGCKKEEMPQKIYFWTTENSDSVQLTLSIDGVNQGRLPYINRIPTPGSPFSCGDDTIRNNALVLSLDYGRYDLEARDASGAIVISAYTKFTPSLTRFGSRDTVGGGGSVSRTDECVHLVLFR